MVVKVLNRTNYRYIHQFKRQYRSGLSVLAEVLIIFIMCHCSILLGGDREIDKGHPRQITVK